MARLERAARYANASAETLPVTPVALTALGREPGDTSPESGGERDSPQDKRATLAKSLCAWSVCMHDPEWTEPSIDGFRAASDKHPDRRSL